MAETAQTETRWLNTEQEARAEALKRARDVLASATIPGRNGIDPTDVHSLADYIITGNDPWARRNDPPPVSIAAPQSTTRT